ncbi:signal transduction histidine kinase (STHK), LytS [Chamaesiphon sp. VAR_48_metabat_135_sub]|uniref:signal transduction histidine kinase (STHK), LytS n=1 Tax=Chamaesiphon sp. VAR_48_metabat_135_sub TaxID=2964699 RepID=UPI00286BDDD7|nr:signal transduction histidine kinase (STHK), LytS [Chamaesiphon sp. VAR_48_metabat_135_sub]
MLKQRAVGTFSDYETTETALHELKNSGFLMDRVSVVGRGINNQIESTGANTSTLMNIGNLGTDENVAEEGAKTGAVTGSAIGGVAGLLVGLGAIAIPGVGPVMLAGAAATAIATTISGSFIGAAAGSLAGGLLGLGIPEDRAHVYSDRVSQGDYLVMVEGSAADITLAKSIFSRYGIHEWYAYDFHSDSAYTVTPVTTHYL